MCFFHNEVTERVCELLLWHIPPPLRYASGLRPRHHLLRGCADSPGHHLPLQCSQRQPLPVHCCRRCSLDRQHNRLPLSPRVGTSNGSLCSQHRLVFGHLWPHRQHDAHVHLLHHRQTLHQGNVPHSSGGVPRLLVFEHGALGIRRPCVLVRLYLHVE